MLRLRSWLLMTCLLLTGCGFQLRQPAQLPAVMQRTYIVSSSNDRGLVRELYRSISTPTTAITNDVTSATAVLNLLNVQHIQRVLSVSNTGQPLEFQVAYRVEFSLTANGQTLIAPQTLVLTRNYDYSAGNPLADTQQANVLYASMERDMAQLIMFKLEALGRSERKHP